MSAVNRRRFIKVSALAGAFAANATGAEAKPDRIACTTTTFRGRFPKFPLLEFPAFLNKELGLSNVEIWSRHIPEQTPEFFKKLKSAARDIGSRIINIQLDQPGYDLSNPDDTSRSKSIDTVRRWMDLAKTCGATSLRANTGGKKGQKFVLGRTADAFGQLAEHGKKIGVKILVENHGGHSAKAENIAAIVKDVNSPWCRSLPDFGNFDGTQEERHAFLKQILPYAHLISTKGKNFDKDLNHSPYDIGACVRLAEAEGFKGIYSIEQWSPKKQIVDDLTIAKRIKAIILENL